MITPEEAENLRSIVMSIHLDGRIEGSGTKHQALDKIPDHSYVFRDSQTSCKYHTVIFEAGFSETYHDLVRDMRQWLLHSDGEVQLVILADLNEDKKQLSKQQKTDSFRSRAAKILEEFGNPLGRSKHADILSLMAEQGELATDISSAPARGLNNKIRRVIREVDWIGPITADLEFWELKDSEPYRRGHARLFPELTGSLPAIYAGDVIPVSCQGSFANFDASRGLHLDIDDFLCCLRDGISDHAVERALDFACPNSQADEDGDYQE